jgi:hypothetical protein
MFSAAKNMRRNLTIFAVALISLTGLAQTQPSDRCVVCLGPLGEKFFWFSGPVLPTRQPVCVTCSELESRCAICRLPVGKHGQKLADGRWLCRRDFDAGIFNENEAQRVYEETRRDLQEILAGSGVLPGRNITVSLVDATQLRKQNQSMPSDHEEGAILGLTRTRFYNNKQFQHTISVISGLSRARLSAVCAHEYSHAWLHENLPAERRLDREAVEGFCELVAYKLMAKRNEEIEKKVILANAYTRGQVNAFVQAEAENHFHRIVKWIKTGVDEVLPQSNQGPILAAGTREPPPIQWPPPVAMPTLVPDALTLKGISSGPSRRFVLINDCTLMKNEEGRVRIGTSNVTVRCVDIRVRSAVIQIKGVPGATELFLGAN